MEQPDFAGVVDDDFGVEVAMTHPVERRPQGDESLGHVATHEHDDRQAGGEPRHRKQSEDPREAHELGGAAYERHQEDVEEEHTRSE